MLMTNHPSDGDDNIVEPRHSDPLDLLPAVLGRLRGFWFNNHQVVLGISGGQDPSAEVEDQVRQHLLKMVDDGQLTAANDDNNQQWLHHTSDVAASQHVQQRGALSHAQLLSLDIFMWFFAHGLFPEPVFHGRQEGEAR